MAKGVGDVIYNLLSNDTDVAAIVGTKIFPFTAIEDISYDYIVYNVATSDPTQHKDGVSPLDTVSVQIELYSETLAEVKDLSIKVRNVLDRYSGTTEGVQVQSSSMLDEDGGYADKDRVYLQIQTYSLRVFPIYGVLVRTTDLAVVANGSTQIDLTWSDNATGETGYEVSRSADSENWSLITTTSAEATSYSNTGLSASEAYMYRVRPTNGTNGSEWSNIALGCTDSASTPQSGIAYNRPLTTGTSTSYRTNDDDWQNVNNPYSAAPSYPVSFATLTSGSYTTLASNNSFGNTNRFTDELGTQIYTNGYVVDNLTGLGIVKAIQAVATWDDAIDATTAFSLAGFSDYYMPNNNELLSFHDIDNSANQYGFDYTPFDMAENLYIWSSSTVSASSTESICTLTRKYAAARQVKSGTRKYFICRKHF
jgi:hypothetical protein